MQVLREISSHTADTTNSTSDAIGKLAQLSAALRKSVSGFRLPDASSTASTGQHRVPPVAPDPEVATTGTFRRVSGELNG